MTALSRQNTLFVTEDWQRIYEALTNVSFDSYDQDTLRQAIIGYIRTNYPEEFNDWIGSDEFIIRIDILCWLSQSIAWRNELNSRENFLALAERRDSLIRLAQNVAYTVKRVQPATGEVKITSVKTDQSVIAPDGSDLSNQVITWNDQSDSEWFDDFVAVMNSVFNSRTQFGRPLRKYSGTAGTVGMYRLNSISPAKGTYPFNATVSGGSLGFEIVNVSLDESSGSYSEIMPGQNVPFNILYRSDGQGTGSTGTGFFLPIRQGSIGFQDEYFAESQSARVVNVNTSNINQFDVWVTEVDETGAVIQEWTDVDSAYGDGVSFNTQGSSLQTIYEVLTRTNDQIAIRFGDGKFGQIPVGRFRIWYRTSAPVPQTVRIGDISEMSMVFPYYSSSDNVVHNLTVTFSLQSQITNGAASESNDDIRARANKVFYTQNRMVTGEDYNSFPLNDSSILKIKSVNRTFSGHGLSVPLNDPTGTYGNVKLSGTDGRLYRYFTRNESIVSADVSQLTANQLVSDEIQPLLAKTDKLNMYLDFYDEIGFGNTVTFGQDSLVNAWSRGRFYRAGAAQTVGSFASSSDPLRFIGPDCLVRFSSANGPIVPIDYYIDDGTSENDVLFKGMVEDGSTAYSVFPALRTAFTDSELSSILYEIQLKRSFALRWSQSDATWYVILAENIDKTSDFSLLYTGDTSSSAKDSSWMVYVQYDPDASSDDHWTIIDRGIEYAFESDRQIDFFYANSTAVYDTETRQALRDNVRITSDNESRDSFLRRGIQLTFGRYVQPSYETHVGDGVSKTFRLLATGVDSRSVLVTINGMDQYGNWTIGSIPGYSTITFSSAPSVGSIIAVFFDPTSIQAAITQSIFNGDGSTVSFGLGIVGSQDDNCFVFKNGSFLRPGRDYTTYQTSAQDRIEMSVAPSSGAALVVYSLSGIDGAFVHKRFYGTGSLTLFHTLTSVTDPSAFFVFVGGQLKRLTTDYTLDTSDPSDTKIIFASAPANNADVDVRVLFYLESSSISRTDLTATAGQTQFAVPLPSNPSKTNFMVFVNGTMTTNYSFSGTGITLGSAASAGDKVTSIQIASVMAKKTTDLLSVTAIQTEPDPEFLQSDITLWTTGQLKDDDGYTDVSGITVIPTDTDSNGVYDDPFLFKDFVITDGITDLVLWTKTTTNGFESWLSISPITSPRGTYTSPNYNYHSGDSFDSEIIPVGSIHLDTSVTPYVWLIADSTTSRWVAASDQTQYKYEIGRGSLTFYWDHYSPDSNRIDPSVSNVMDVYVITSGYDSAIRNWVIAGASPSSEPEPETSDQLSVQYSGLSDFKMMSDSMIWHPARYKLLFGSSADQELQATFVVVSMPGSNVPDNDLKLKILSVIDDYFSLDNWNFGDTFYFTELSAYIHTQLSSMLQSVVIVPSASGQSFGNLFQVRSEPDQIFISCATVDNIEVVSSLSNSLLRIPSSS